MDAWLRALESAARDRDELRASMSGLTWDEGTDLRWALEVFARRCERIVAVLVRRYGWQGE